MGRFEEGLQAWRTKDFFEAHEHWEALWRNEADPAIRDGLQGLVQLAASLHKANQGEERGHAKLWAKAGLRLTAAASRVPVLYGLDLEALVADLPTVAPQPADRPRLQRDRPGFGVVYLHGFGSSPGSPKGEAVLGALREASIPVVAPRLADPQEFFDFTVSRSIGRARHALFERTLLVGSSLGGWTGALLARDDPRIVELVLLCPAFHFPERWLGPDRRAELAQWREAGWLEFEVGHPPVKRALGVEFLHDALEHDGGVRPSVPTQVFHGRSDEVVPLIDVERTTEGLENVRLELVDDDHGLRRTLPRIARCVQRTAQRLGSTSA